MRTHGALALLMAAAAAAAPAAESTSDPLAAAIASPSRTPKNVARDVYRHPLQTLQFFGGTVVTPAMTQYFDRVQGDLKAATARYNTFVTQQVPQLNTTLQALKLKPITANQIH